MNFSFHPEAEEEFNKAIEPGLGYDFALEVYSAIQRAVEYPTAWAVLDGEVRRCWVPYGVLYTAEHAEIFVVALMNLHRQPDYWIHRK